MRLVSVTVWFDTQTHPKHFPPGVRSLPYYGDMETYSDNVLIEFFVPNPDLIPEVERNLAQFLKGSK